MILVDDAGGEWPMIGHAPWNGCNLADFVMPFFLFIVGISIALALKVVYILLLVQHKDSKEIPRLYIHSFLFFFGTANIQSACGCQEGDSENSETTVLGSPITRSVGFILTLTLSPFCPSIQKQ